MIYYWSPYLTSYIVGGAVPAGLPYSFSALVYALTARIKPGTAVI